MARIFMDGFESGSFDLWDTRSGTVNSSVSGRQGSYCAENVQLSKNVAAASSYYCAFKLQGRGVCSTGIGFYNNTTLLGELRPNSQVWVLQGASGTLLNSANFVNGTWYLCELY